MTRRAPASLAASPVLVGALTVLVTIVAVFLAYNANNGLPFVPTYQLDVRLPDAETLVRGNEVRIGGIRVGRVASVTAERDAEGDPVAIAHLELNEEVKPLPVDSTVLVRPRSPVALKYLEIEPGESEEGFAEGDTVPVEAATPEPVELDQVLNTFDARTRRAIQLNTAGYGDALAGRGPAINELFINLRGLVEVAEPALANLAEPTTRFGRFWKRLADTAAEVAPVAATQAELFGNLDTTFAAFADVAYPYIQETISASPPTLDEGTRSLPVLRPFFEHSEEFFVAFEPGARALGETSPVIADTFRVGSEVLPQTPELNRELEPTADALLDFQEADGVETGLSLLQDTNDVLDPTLAHIAPAQTTCNYLSLLFRNVASIGSLGNEHGTWTRFIAFAPPTGPNNEGSPASAPANGPSAEGPGRLNHLHYNPYPNTASPGQPLECEAGNEGYRLGETMIGNVPGNQGIRTGGQTEDQLARGGEK